MADYIIGDVQGCFDELQALLKTIQFNPKTDVIWFAGDLVARGSQSLETLRFIKSLGESARTVLGNHDLHLLAIQAKLKKAKPQDKLQALIDAPDFEELTDWLSQQPLLLNLPQNSGYLSHAGISPQWSISQATENALFAEKKIAGKNRKKWLAIMYGEQPNSWHQVTNKEERFRYTINAFTRMRYCYPDGSLDFANKGGLDSRQKTLVPWFDLVEHQLKDIPWVFGHWAALMGKTNKRNIYALDTGCVWGNHLTALRWQDKRVFGQKSLNH